MDMTRSLTERLVAVRACTVQKIAIPLALLVFIAAPTVLLHWDFWLPAQAGRDELTVDQVEVALPVDQLLSLRQQLSHQAHETHFEPSLGLVQQSHNIQVLPSHTLAILPPFANPQTLAAPDGSIVFLEPEPYLHDAQDVVNHTADTAVEGSKLLKQNQKHAAATRGQPTDMPQPNFGPVKRSALVIALTSSADRIAVIEAGRSWRRGVRTHVSLETANPAGLRFQEGRKMHNESYGYYRDLQPNTTSSTPDALRAAMTPFLANQSIGVANYKWMLFGEDDTVFFIFNALKLLEHLDHNVPYILTDNIQYPQQHVDGEQYVAMNPNPRAPRCLPCNYTDPLQGHYHNPQSFNATPACPCTQTHICHTDNLWLTDQACSFRFNPPGHGNTFHRGAGVIISSGLMRMLNFHEVEQYMGSRSLYQSGESMLADMVWRKLGLLPTDPGYGYFRPHVRLFDPGWRGPLVRGSKASILADYGNDPVGVISRLAVALQGWCNVECEDQLQHVISTHLRSDYASELIDMTHVRNSLSATPHSVPDAQAAAVYFHMRFGDLLEKYDRRQHHRKWFDVYDF